MATEGRGKPKKRRAAIPALERHYGSWRWRPTVDGKRVTIPLHARTEAEAIAEVLRIQQRGLQHATSGWEDAVDSYLHALHHGRPLSTGTKESRGAVLRQIGREMDLATPRSLTPAVASLWLRRLQQRTDISPGTRLHYLRDLRTFARWCVARGLLSADPTEGLHLPAPQEKLRDVFVPSEKIAVLLAAARADGDRDLEFILALGAECGMRRGEVDACRPEWFDLKNGTVTIPAIDDDWARKGREGRRRSATISLSDVFLDIISRHGLPEPYVVAPHKAARGKHRYRFEFRRRFEKLMRAHGLSHVTFHDLRRSFASNRLSAGVSLEKVANWMGIDRETAWKRYSRFIPSDAEINRGSAVLSMPPPPRTPQLPQPQRPDPPPAKSIAQRLATVDQLHASGLITDEERAAKRAAILAEI